MKIPIIIFTLGLCFLPNEYITLEDLRWKKRIVLIFPESKDYMVDVSDSLQMKMEERDMVYFVFSDSLYSNTDFEFDSTYVEELKSRYILGAKTSCWVLLGKDGGLKLSPSLFILKSTRSRSFIPNFSLLTSAVN